MHFKMEQFLRASGAKVLREGRRSPCTGVSTDTRTLKAGELFFCLKGPHFDGHQFIQEAVQKGAWGVVVQNAPSTRCPVPGTASIFGVPDTLTALGDIALWWRRQFDIPVVAVTGSNGKTTTREMTASILAQKFNVLKTEGNFNNLIGVPMTLNRLGSDHQAGVIEMGMNAPGEIARLTEMAAPAVGVVTNAAAAHLEKLGTVEAVARAKGELYAALPPNAVAVYNAEDPWMQKEAQKFAGKKMAFGMRADCDVRFEHMENIGFDSMELKLAVREKIIEAALKTTGIHNVMNAMAACTAALALGIDIPAMQAGLESFVPLKMRFEVTQLANGVRLINDAYNANPASMETAFKTVARQPRAGRFLAVLGDMKELGEASKKWHAEIGEKAAAAGVDALFLVGEFASSTAGGARKKGLNASQVKNFDDVEALIPALEEMIRAGDIVLVKASRAMQLERVAEALKEKFGD